ncbi:hypothetical protein BaRGS_00002053 [Batillaria attramentaria]|uniref:Secreted protein n=1 Tax=Batillaria attramentaria TaxID=370345 RepID=A0ABD0M570_9CAEN
MLKCIQTILSRAIINKKRVTVVGHFLLKLFLGFSFCTFCWSVTGLRHNGGSGHTSRMSSVWKKADQSPAFSLSPENPALPRLFSSATWAVYVGWPTARCFDCRE